MTLTPEREQQLVALIGRVEKLERKIHQSFSDDDHSQYFLTDASKRITGDVIIDRTSTEALLVRKHNDTGDVFVVDTTNARAGIGGTPSQALDLVSGSIEILTTTT